MRARLWGARATAQISTTATCSVSNDRCQQRDRTGRQADAATAADRSGRPLPVDHGHHAAAREPCR